MRWCWPLYLVQGVTHGRQEVLIGRADGAVQVELDHRLGLADRRDLALVIGVAQHVFGDVGGELHHLVGLAARVEDRVVAGLDPQFAAALAHPHVAARVELTAAQLLPEAGVLG